MSIYSTLEFSFTDPYGITFLTYRIMSMTDTSLQTLSTYVFFIGIMIFKIISLDLFKRDPFLGYKTTGPTSKRHKRLERKRHMTENLKHMLFIVFRKEFIKKMKVRTKKRNLISQIFHFFLFIYSLTRQQTKGPQYLKIDLVKDKLPISTFQQTKFLAQTDETEPPIQAFTRAEELERFSLFSATLQKVNKIINFDSDSFRLLVDTGASSSATNCKEDFLPGTYTEMKGVVIKGISSGLVAKGYGTVAWCI